MNDRNFVFVYGTLRAGGCRAGVLGTQGMICEEAYVPDFKLLDIGSFPGVVKGEGTVRGEMHAIDERTLTTLDSIEGYHEDDLKHSLYIRKTTPVLDTEGNLMGDAWIYIYNTDRSHGRRVPPTIQSGDWFEHRGLYTKESST